jgi:hypothetical protein
MAKGTSCIWKPETKTGKESKSYRDMIDKYHVPISLANYIYARYLFGGISARMTSEKGYKETELGEHTAEDILEEFNYQKALKESTDLFDTAQSLGAITPTGEAILYDSSEEALEKAVEFNEDEEHRGIVAYVIKNGDNFQIQVIARDIAAQEKAAEAEQSLNVWRILTYAFFAKGIDIDSDLAFNDSWYASNSKSILDWLNTRRYIATSLFSKEDMQTVLTILDKGDPSSSRMARLKRKFGDIEGIAIAAYQAQRPGHTFTHDEVELLNGAMDEAKNFLSSPTGLDTARLVEEANKIYDVEKSQSALSKHIKSLTIPESDKREIEGSTHTISSLREAAADAVIVLKRQLSELRRKEGITSEVRDLNDKINKIVKEIEKNNFSQGLLGFLSEALEQIDAYNDLFNSASVAPGQNLMRAKIRARALMKMKDIHDGYYPLVLALSNIDSLAFEASIGEEAKKNIQEQAKKIKDIFDKRETILSKLRKSTMIDILSEFLGNSNVLGPTLTDILSLAKKTSIYDVLYSMTRVSSEVAAVAGTIIRDKQTERNKKLADIDVRVRRATNKLFKAGIKNTTFMYESVQMADGSVRTYIVSDIDWAKYNKDRKQARRELWKMGFRGLDLEESMLEWQSNHTVRRLVDGKSGRTELVPDTTYRKDFTLNEAEREYYDTIMQIKGELGTLIPNYAQFHYKPPQVRRNFKDAVRLDKTASGVAKALLNSIKDPWVLREDEEWNVKNGAILNGEDYGISTALLNNVEAREIPIFYVNDLKDQGELLKDFSGAMMRFAGTAINFDAMYDIVDTIEFMQDFIDNSKETATEVKSGKVKVEALKDSKVTIYKKLDRYCKENNTSTMLQSMISSQIYGHQLKDPPTIKTKLLRNLLNYSSKKALTTNIKGMVSNWFVGELQGLIEAGGGEFFNTRDYIKAHGYLFGRAGMGGVIMDYFSNNVNSKAVLLSRIFDPLSEQFEGMKNSKFYKHNLIGHLLNGDYHFLGYQAGEQIIHYLNMYSVLFHQKCLIDGKKGNLFDAFELTDKVDGSKDIKLKDNVQIEKDGKYSDITDDDIDRIIRIIRYVNQTSHGAMNSEDKGLVHQYLLGRFVMNLRQWMVEHYSRRFRKKHWDGTLREYREGYYTTTQGLLFGLAKDLMTFHFRARSRWAELDKGQRANVKRAMREIGVFLTLLLGSLALGSEDDTKGDLLKRFILYQLKRAMLDTRGSMPGLVFWEARTMLNSPIPAVTTINGIAYIFSFGDLDKQVETGRYSDEEKYPILSNKYFHHVYKYAIPYLYHIDSFLHMGEEDDSFAVFHNPFQLY